MTDLYKSKNLQNQKLTAQCMLEAT